MKPHEKSAPPAEPDEPPHPITVLSNLYLEIGLPLSAAVQSALADFETLFDEAAAEAGLCAP